MRLDPDELYHGASPVLLQSAFKLLSKNHERFSIREFCIAFGAPVDECQPIVDGLLKDGFIELRGSVYEFTDSSTRLLNAKITKGMTKKEAVELLNKVIKKAEMVNSNPEFGHTVDSLCIFGSYLTGKEVLGDLDIGYLVTETPGAFTSEQKERKLNSNTYRYTSYAGSKYREVLKLLKLSNKHVSLHSMSEVISMNTPYTEIFPRA